MLNMKNLKIFLLSAFLTFVPFLACSAPLANCGKIVYPKRAIDTDTEGFVTIEYQYEIDGSITNARVAKSTGPTREHKQLDELARQSILACNIRREPSQVIKQPGADSVTLEFFINDNRYSSRYDSTRKIYESAMISRLGSYSLVRPLLPNHVRLGFYAGSVELLDIERDFLTCRTQENSKVFRATVGPKGYAFRQYLNDALKFELTKLQFYDAQSELSVGVFIEKIDISVGRQGAIKISGGFIINGGKVEETLVSDYPLAQAEGCVSAVASFPYALSKFFGILLRSPKFEELVRVDMAGLPRR
jgi:TonB family protein